MDEKSDKKMPALTGSEELTVKQLRFVAEYLKDGNATQACIRAGYSPKDARKHGSELLKHPVIRKAIDEIRAQIGQQAEYNMASAVKEIDKFLDLCERKENFNPVPRLLEHKLKLHGFLEDVLRVKHEKVDIVAAIAEGRKRMKEAIDVTPETEAQMDQSKVSEGETATEDDIFS